VFTICLDNYCPFSWRVTSGPNNNTFSTFLCHPFKKWIASGAKYLSFRSGLSKLMWYRLQISMGCSCQCHLPHQNLCTSMPSMCQFLCWRFICCHMCTRRLQPSLYLRSLRFWTERKLVLYLTFSFQPIIQVLNMYKIYSTKNLEYYDFLQQWICPLQISSMGLCLFIGDW
jgi:hypothetical protein